MFDNLAIAPKQTEKFTISYRANPTEGGTFLVDDGTGNLTETNSQKVAQGAIPTKVVAKPAAGYIFLGWSNGVTSLEWSDSQPIFQNQELTARFVKDDQVVITYRSIPSAGGLFLVENSEVQEQLLPKGADAKLVVAMANDGYRFVQWSDNGSTNPQRTLTAVARIAPSRQPLRG